MNIPMSLRTEAGELEYAKARANNQLIPLADEPAIIQYKHWRLITNRFPYTTIFKLHDMLIPCRVVATRAQLNAEELVELHSILQELENQYSLVFENFSAQRSIKGHYHLHLARYWSSRSEMIMVSSQDLKQKEVA